MQPSHIVQILNGDPSASPLAGAHRRGAPYSSHRAPQEVRLRLFTRCGLAWDRRVSARRGGRVRSLAFMNSCGVLLLSCLTYGISMFLRAETVSPQSAKKEEARRSGPLCQTGCRTCRSAHRDFDRFRFCLLGLGQLKIEDTILEFRLYPPLIDEIG